MKKRDPWSDALFSLLARRVVANDITAITCLNIKLLSGAMTRDEFFTETDRMMLAEYKQLSLHDFADCEAAELKAKQAEQDEHAVHLEDS